MALLGTSFATGNRYLRRMETEADQANIALAEQQHNESSNTNRLYRVVSVSDGDTIVVDMNGIEERVRLIGVDTPETHHPELPVQCFGEAASAFTKSLVENSAVRLEADADNTNRDRYDRLLRYAYTIDGTLLNLKIIEEGYGFAYLGFPFQKSDQFSTAEAAAKAQGKGLWSGCSVDENQRNPQTLYPGAT